MIKQEKKRRFFSRCNLFFLCEMPTELSKHWLATNKERIIWTRVRVLFLPKEQRHFQKNVEFDVMLTFKGSPKGAQLRSVTANASLVTVHQHHSFVALPDNAYKPRKI